ncbi:MAG: hypothetical protein RI894_2172 [Bacteroidota bacterium]
MNILHTSDWHLGQRFVNQDRYAEHQAALAWLQETVVSQKIDVLLVSGDIFDGINPSHEARKLYYRFLASLVNTCCRHIIVTGGNHDSALMLNASKELLEILNIWVVGEATNPIANEVIELKNSDGETELFVAAVPFLRERDLRNAVAGESYADRVSAIRVGITAHYDSLAQHIQAINAAQRPVVAMGHLYATGAEDNKEQPSKIYVGNLENLEATAFSPVFDYVALGHIHRPQNLQGQTLVRYSGSIIPLSFTEVRDTKSVTIIRFAPDRKPQIEVLEMPTFRKLRTLIGTMDELKTKLTALQPAQQQTKSWVELIIQTDGILINPLQELTDFVANLPIEILKCRLERVGEEPILSTSLENSTTLLAELDVNDVFAKRLAATDLNDDDKHLIEQAFLELQSF